MSFFYFIRRIIFAGLLSTLAFTGCSLFDKNADQEIVKINLPDWPPAPEYPQLSRWKITISESTGTSVFHKAPGSTIEIKTQKNCPFSIQAHPITQLKDGNECLFFHPAGFIYPSSAENKLTWEHGYPAFIMEGLYKNCRQNGFSASEAAEYVSTFNWAKMISYIQEQINKSITEEKKFYNPWLCDSSKISKNLSNETFRTSLLSLSSCYQLSTENIRQKYTVSIFSPFIPENPIIAKTGLITIKKDTPLFLSDGKEFGLFINYLSAKNVHIEYIYIPIYKEEI